MSPKKPPAGNHYGAVRINGEDLFAKSVPIELYDQEISGYHFISKYFPAPRLVGGFTLGNVGIILYCYEKSIKKNSGLLVDLFAHNTALTSEFRQIVNMFRAVFLNNYKLTHPTTSKVFFEDRVETRLASYYSPSFIRMHSQKKLVINDLPVTLDLQVILNQTKKYFSTRRKYWSVPSQGDPNDLNIATKPLVFDYLAGGWVPLMAEFATLFWYNLAQGQRLSLLYNKRAFEGHPDIYKALDSVLSAGSILAHHPSSLRKEFLTYYIKRVIRPFVNQLPLGYPSWYEDFKFFLTVKILGVFNVSEMSQEDQLLSLGYLGLFHSIKITDPEQLLEYL